MAEASEADFPQEGLPKPGRIVMLFSILLRANRRRRRDAKLKVSHPREMAEPPGGTVDTLRSPSSLRDERGVTMPAACWIVTARA